MPTSPHFWGMSMGRIERIWNRQPKAALWFVVRSAIGHHYTFWGLVFPIAKMNIGQAGHKRPPKLWNPLDLPSPFFHCLYLFPKTREVHIWIGLVEVCKKYHYSHSTRKGLFFWHGNKDLKGYHSESSGCQATLWESLSQYKKTKQVHMLEKCLQNALDGYGWFVDYSKSMLKNPTVKFHSGFFL